MPNTKMCLFIGLFATSLTACSPDTSGPPPNASQETSRFIASAKGRIDIEGGVIKLAARRDGIVQKVLVEEGDWVKTGQLLAVLDDEQSRLSAELARAEVEQARRSIPAQEVRLAAARREFRRLAPLAKDNIAARQEFDQAGDQVQILTHELTATKASLNVALQRLKVSDYEIEMRTVRAPLAGKIVRRTARPGDGVSTLNVTPLFLFAPDAERIVRAELEERFLSVVKPGQTAEVVLEADEAHRFPGKVLRVGHVVGARTPTDDPNEKQDNRVVECVLTLQAPELLIGQRVIVRFARGV